MYMERPPYPATRLDVQRHYLEDKRAGYAFMNPDPRDDRGTSLAQAFQAIRQFVARTIVADRRQPTATSHEHVAGTVETAESI